MTEPRNAQPGVVVARPEIGGGAATPSFRLPDGATPGLPGRPSPLRIGPATFDWGTRTFVMGILNVTPDSFSGDGLLATPTATIVGSSDEGLDRGTSALDQARRMLSDGADLLDVGGESSRPGHAAVDAATEIARIVPLIATLRAVFPATPISVDTIKPSVGAAALDAGADLINDVWGVAPDDGLLRLAAERGVPIVLMHNRAEARYTNLMAEVLGDLQTAIDRALRVGVAWDAIIVDPGFGFGKTPDHNLALLHDLALLRALGRPILLGTSRKSTLGKVLDLPPDERVEATIATTALAIAAGVDIVRVHDVRPNVRAARMADAIVRGHPAIAAAPNPGGPGSAPMPAAADGPRRGRP